MRGTALLATGLLALSVTSAATGAPAGTAPADKPPQGQSAPPAPGPPGAPPPADKPPQGQSAPPGPALSPEAAMARMKLPPGFKAELVAAEPDLVNPTAFTFDDRGRIWVTESVEYPRRDP